MILGEKEVFRTKSLTIFQALKIEKHAPSHVTQYDFEKDFSFFTER